MSKHLVIDLNNLAMRARAKDPGLCNSSGIGTGIVYGMLKMVKSLCHEYKPLSISLCEDSGYNKSRMEFYPEYKQQRRKAKEEKTEEEIKSYEEYLRQRDRFLKYMKFCNVKVFRYKHTEADDIIGYIAHLCNLTKPFTYQGNMKHKIVIVSTDNDFKHLVSECVDYYTPVKNELWTREYLDPELELFQKSINGDSGDGISGIKGVGSATITEAFNSIPYVDREQFYSACTNHSNNRIKKIGNNKDIVERNIKIISLHYGTGFVRYLSPETKSAIKDLFFNPVKTLNYDQLLSMSHEDDFKSIFTNVKGYFWWPEKLIF